eukprot:CAMPEP_0178911614 /NCGR_PEP_ID=MMETSP0786-20121207/9798_1 /TAXON_ID=186022 /ORGANISM="Thalassionema frauenfeldii, Strain CCMP 1798" /LENGTH=831 /DNA_ID=CAMNT_0020584091 /DNA_START=182 /DNA_END=2679 /DNA_ORIENTATION=+
MKFSSYTLSALHAQLLISSFGIYESSAFHTLSPTAHNNCGSAGRTNVDEVDLGRRIGSRQFPCFASAVEGELESVIDEFLGEEEDDDIDSVLDSMLGEIYTSDENGKRGSEKREHIPGSSTMPSSLVEKDDIDITDPNCLSITNPRWLKAGLDQEVIDILSEKGITKFTPVQAEAFGPVVAGRDVIGRSRTGTGKTLAFGLPSITRIVKKLQDKGVMSERGALRRGRSVSMLVLCPTRELARQVQEELKQVAKPSGLFVEVFHGGVSYDPQARALRAGLDILVGTPGRVIDHIERGNLDLSECEIAVLDEADEMLNMGFAEDVEVVLDGIGSKNEEKTQCLLFSATTPPWVKEIGRQYQQDVLSIDSTSEDAGARTAKTVRHLAVQLPPGADSKKSILEDIIAVEISKDIDDDEEGVDESENPIAAAAAESKKKTNSAMQQKIFGKTIVFTQTKREADELVSGGVFKSLTAQALHGDVGQKQRDATLAAFRKGSFNVLVATDVAARGIDIQDVDLVIQFDPPRDVDTYVHRSGRTGRAGNKGVSVLLFNNSQARDIVKIERDLGHGFKFELAGPPSTEAALKAAAKTSACSGVPDETAQYFKESAKSLLESGESAEDVVARCLAAISRRSASVQSRSLLTGEEGLVTVQMSNEDGNRVAARDVMFTVGKLSRMSQREGDDLSFDSDIGKIQSNFDSGTAIFDMSVDDAKRLVEFSKDINAGGARFQVLKELEVERDANLEDANLEDAVGGLVEGVAEVEEVVEEAGEEAGEEDIKDDLMGNPVVETIMVAIIALTMKDDFRETTGVELKVVTAEAMTVVDVATVPWPYGKE